MDLIYTDSSRTDVGILKRYELDLAFGTDENSLECTIDAKDHCCAAGCLLYIEDTEYGGIVDSIQSNTGTGNVIYKGRTWHGVLGSKVIVPLKASDASSGGVTVKTTSGTESLLGRYLIISGEANACIRWLIARLGLSALFAGSSAASGITISEFQFNRYTDAYSGLRAMLASASAKLKISFNGTSVDLSATARVSTDDDAFNSDLIDFKLKKKYKTCNHLICLGSGELENRTVVHLYADASGNISQSQTFTGLDEITEVFDYPSAESQDELINSGTERLRELIDSTTIEVDCTETQDTYDIGDVLTATDEITGISVSAAVTKKIVKIQNGETTVDYKVGE